MMYSNKRIILLVLTIFVMAVSSEALIEKAEKAMKAEKEIGAKKIMEDKKEKSTKQPTLSPDRR